MAVLPRLLGRPHVFLYRLTGGILGGRIFGCPVLLLTTTGRKSGKAITVPLLFVEDGETPGIIASYGGSPTHPAWYLNIQSNPNCLIQIRRRRIAATAESVQGPERDRLWEKAVQMYPAYADYQRKTSRRIPIVRLRAFAASG